MIKRTLSGIILTVMTVAAFVEGKYLLLLFLAAASLIGLFELYRTIGTDRAGNGAMTPLSITGYAAALVYFAALFLGADEKKLLLIFPAMMLLMMLVYVFSYPRYEPSELFGTFFGVIYIPVMLSAVYMLRGSEGGRFTVWLIFIGSWVCDTCAYFAGTLMGSHKLAPELSPKKSVEGAVGGVAGSALVGFIYGILAGRLTGGIDASPLLIMLISAVAAVFSQAGDLTASAIKRHFGVKDYGSIIPGHGGVLDRFDSVIVTAPLIYIFFLLF